MTIHKWEPFKNEPWYLWWGRYLAGRLGTGGGLLGHMWGIKLGKNLNLLLDILYLVFCAFKVNNLDGYSFPRPFIEAERRLYERTLGIR